MIQTTGPAVPILDLRPELTELWDELNTAIQRVLHSGQFVMGPEVAAFEGEVAAYLGAKHAVGVNSGTDALVIGLRALGVGAGDEVITTPFSFFATAESISMVGARPVFADIDPSTFNLDPGKIEEKISARTKAVMPVHLYGRPCDMDPIMAVASAHGLKVIEDCAQSFGAHYRDRHTGTIGDVGAYSFYPTKNLGAYGDGGLIVTDDAAVAAHARLLQNHGAKARYHHETLGYNSRLDSLQAAILRVKLPHVEGWNQKRRQVAKKYNDLLRELPEIVTPELSDGHVFHQYTIRLTGSGRDEVRTRLEEDGISTTIYYPIPQDRQPVYQGGYETNPVSDELSAQVLSLPIWPGIGPEMQERVSEALARALG